LNTPAIMHGSNRPTAQ